MNRSSVTKSVEDSSIHLLIRHNWKQTAVTPDNEVSTAVLAMIRAASLNQHPFPVLHCEGWFESQRARRRPRCKAIVLCKGRQLPSRPRPDSLNPLANPWFLSNVRQSWNSVSIVGGGQNFRRAWVPRASAPSDVDKYMSSTHTTETFKFCQSVHPSTLFLSFESHLADCSLAGVTHWQAWN